jgi:hypothetical protein
VHLEVILVVVGIDLVSRKYELSQLLILSDKKKQTFRFRTLFSVFYLWWCQWSRPQFQLGQHFNSKKKLVLLVASLFD